MLSTLLSNHPRLECRREIFLPINRDPETYNHFKDAAFSRKINHYLRRQVVVNAFLEAMYTEPVDVDGLGFKFMYSQIKFFPQVIPWAKKNDVKIVHLVRKNVLKMLISQQLS